MNQNLYKQYAIIFKALADETRLRIMRMLCCNEMCACKILEPLNITQPTLSYHMKVLTECGLVVGRREGSWIKYSVNEQKVKIITEQCIAWEKERCNHTTVNTEI